jgi:hypothetical protein
MKLSAGSLLSLSTGWDDQGKDPCHKMFTHEAEKSEKLEHRDEANFPVETNDRKCFSFLLTSGSTRVDSRAARQIKTLKLG